MGKRLKKTFLQRRHTDGQEAREKMSNITTLYNPMDCTRVQEGLLFSTPSPAFIVCRFLNYGNSDHFGGKVKLIQLVWRTVWRFQKKTKAGTTI